MAESRKVNVAKRSGFDKTYRNTLTAHCGTLVPIFFDEVIPDSKINLKVNLAAALPPLVSDTYMNVRLRLEAFAIPHRLLYGNFEDFFCDFPAETGSLDVSDGSVDIDTHVGLVPLISLTDGSDETDINTLVGDSSLSDYLGFYNEEFIESNILVNVLPFVAYHLIWQEWYRNPRVQKPAFVFPSDGNLSVSVNAVPALHLPYLHIYDMSGQPRIMPVYNAETDAYVSSYYKLADGKNILSLRQRNFDLDYFTGAMVEPQQGDVAKVVIEDGGFTIPALRAQNSIMQFRERNNLTSPRYNAQLFARYGVSPSDGVLQRPALIGAASYDVYSHGVQQTSQGGESEGNPFIGSLGARAGSAFAAGQDYLIKRFHAKEPMFIMVLASLVPDVTYAQGINPILRRYIGKGSISDMANHILQNVGPQPVRVYELYDIENDNIFAYVDRYADWMIIKNQAHGKFRYGENLQSFVLQRHFESAPEYGSQFLTIPTDYLDGVLVADAATMGFAYWMDIMLEYHMSQPLQEYSIPSLQDPAYEHGRTIVLRKNGQLL